MRILGLTGGIASGKSFVTQIFEQGQIPVVDADLLSREAVKPGTRGLKQIEQLFGEAFLNGDGTLNRTLMGQHVFSHPEARKLLGKILHPEIRKLSDAALKRHKEKGHPLAIYSATLLYESGRDKDFDGMICVWCPLESQRKRLQKRDKLNPAQATARLDTQMPLDEKRDRADWIIDNSGSKTQTIDQIKQLLTTLHKLA